MRRPSGSCCYGDLPYDFIVNRMDLPLERHRSIMFEPLSVYNAYTALIAGLVTSVHCVAMCGPLSCAFAPSKRSDAQTPVILTSYHLAKLFSYGLAGTLAGARIGHYGRGFGFLAQSFGLVARGLLSCGCL